MSGNVTASPVPAAAADLSCEEAANLLGVPPAALARWARQMAYPQGDDTGRFRRAEIEALRDALINAHSVEGAVRAARGQTEPGSL